MANNNKKPDLIISYRNEIVKNIKLSENLSNYIIYGNVFNNLQENISIGKFTVTGSLTNVDNLQTFNENFVCILPEGTITWFASGSDEVQNNGVYKPGTLDVCKILHGSGDFAYSSGVVFQNVLPGNARIAYVYFDK
jgi:hypothetical protein